VGLNLTSSSVIQANWQYCSVSTSSSAFTTLDAVYAGINFGGATGFGIAANTQKSLELRSESLSRLPAGAARYVRLQVALSSSSSTTDMCAFVNGSFLRYPPTLNEFGQSSIFSSSISNQIYTSVGGGSSVPAI
jgi:hypothetical protein